MGQVDLLWITAALLSSPLLTLCQPLNILSAPNILRVGNSENVFVEAQDYAGGPLNVRIVVKNHPQKNRELASESVVLSAASNYQALAAIKIPENKEVFNSGPLGKQYVYLQAHFPSGVLEKEVLVSFQSGYIFIQTDKSIYTPNSTGIVLVRETFLSKQGTLTMKYEIPEIASPGIWTVAARYKYAPQKNFTAEFEVKEYVLPTFEVTLNPSKSFFYIDDDRLQVDITAKYLFGNKVEGSAFVVFGVMQGDSRTSLPASLRRENVTGRATLTKEMIQKTFPDIKQLIGNSLYISVSVLTETGSEMVEAQRRGIYIVTSPYTIYFKRTPKFFKPGMPFDVMVYVTNPDQTPAENVDVVVSPGGGQSRTKVNGMAKVTVNTHAGAKTLEIKVKTNDPGIPNNRQDEKQMTALVYTTKGGSSNYLHIGIDVEELKVGDNMKVSLHFVRSDGVKNQDFTYLILSKGLIVQANRFKRQGHSLVTLSVPVTKDMLPSFRVVAYYHVGSSEVVADSVWVDVKDTCMGKLRVEVKEPKKSYEPGERFGLKITGDSAATVGLVAVDKGVFVLNKNRLTQEKIWDIIEKEDTGCTAGSGKDSMGVFYDAGLLFQSDKAGGTGSRTSTFCPCHPSTDLSTFCPVGNYRGDQKKCCADGLRPNKLGYTCERRATFIIDGQECIQAFLTCCKEIQKVKNKNVEEQMLLARSEEEEGYTSADEITSRTQFPESWLWEDRVLPGCQRGQCAITTLNMDNIQLKDSITTWQILAISLSQTHGICVADPYEMVVKKDFFLDLKLPYSAVRNEQLEIKAVLHNFSNKNQKVRVDFIGTENVCSAASKKGRYRTIVNVGAQSSRSVSYIIVPMELGNHSIEVKAAVYESTLTDGVRKTLKVVVSVSQELSITVQQAISGDFMGRLIVQPGGCGEQNMVYMTLPLIATYYLDTTKQWERVGIHRRAEAIRHIQKGEKSYHFNDRDVIYFLCFPRVPFHFFPSPTWLTAYVAKVFAMASGLVPIQENVVCSALQWLVLNAQMPDGIFIEKAPVSHGGMDADASLTAFVLIAMQEGNELCAKSVPSLAQSMWKAIQYLERRIPSLTNPYAVAMTSYAMANAGKFDKALLMRYSSGDGAYWEVTSGHHFSLEATAYALLALVKAKQLEEAGKAVNWLNRQTSPYGSSGTTQATIMVFQSVAEYYKRASGYQSGELDVEVSVRGRPDSIRWIFKRETSHLTYSEKVNLNQEFTVTAKGHGVGSLKVITLYYASPTEKESDCRDFDLTIKMERQREVKYPGAQESYLNVVIFIHPHRYKSPTRDATMSILDIGLLTGFVVDEKDLSDLITGSDRYIQKFEMDKQLSERGSLILYLDKVSHGIIDRIAFGVHKISEVAMLQPAGITVYEYYSPEKRCTKFYHPTKKDGALNKLCNEQEGVCECAEENCSIQKKQKIEEKDREKVACQSNIDYVYRVKVMKTDRSPYTDHHTMTIEQVLKGDYLEQGQVRSFRGHTNCRESYGFVEGKVYLIMGQSRDLPKTDGRLQYVLDDQTWIEYWPTYEEGQTPEYRDKYVGITGLAQNLVKFGC
uniref:Anaphylatoxin-like domain-containing protein n=1 Tax=Pygocentrus nattereri TaxID=42514 RepID=A0AAR2K8X8_PYGNA